MQHSLQDRGRQRFHINSTRGFRPLYMYKVPVWKLTTFTSSSLSDLNWCFLVFFFTLLVPSRNSTSSAKRTVQRFLIGLSRFDSSDKHATSETGTSESSFLHAGPWCTWFWLALEWASWFTFGTSWISLVILGLCSHSTSVNEQEALLERQERRIFTMRYEKLVTAFKCYVEEGEYCRGKYRMKDSVAVFHRRVVY